ncbi:DUF805 domain-containing protein [Nocardioides sp.]|uniref:DUF805 domain-containing protein n=1 Tax=Nocardioides sp. TaxID=35761 RepID=UPI002EDB81FE
MTFTESVQTCLRKYAGFSGRAGRPEFWWFMVFNVLVSFVTSIVDMAVFGSDAVWAGIGFGPDQGPFQLISAFLLLLPDLAVGARRLHDTARSAWWLLLLLVPFLGLLVLVVLWCLRGEAGTNRYGEPPVRTGPPR